VPAGPSTASSRTSASDNVSEVSDLQPNAVARESVDVIDVPAVKTESEESKAASADDLQKARMEEIKQKVNEAIPKVREVMQRNARSLDFRVAEEENRVIITVIDKETNKVIRQIPPEDVLQIAESIDQGLGGIPGGSILNSKA
jgi:flagellar protein FlaG